MERTQICVGSKVTWIRNRLPRRPYCKAYARQYDEEGGRYLGIGPGPFRVKAFLDDASVEKTGYRMVVLAPSNDPRPEAEAGEVSTYYLRLL